MLAVNVAIVGGTELEMGGGGGSRTLFMGEMDCCREMDCFARGGLRGLTGCVMDADAGVGAALSVWAIGAVADVIGVFAETGTESTSAGA